MYQYFHKITDRYSAVFFDYRNARLIVFVVALFFTAYSVVFADICDSAKRLCPPTSDTNIQRFIIHVLQAIVQLAIPLIAVFLVYSGYLFLVAQGNSSKLAIARTNLYYAIIGSALILGAWVFVDILGSTVSSIIEG